MKIKISGMMDYIQDESVHVGGEAGVSAGRIREKTMASLGAAPKERGRPRRVGRILLIAAAVAAVLSLSVAAVASRIPSLAEMQGPETNFGPTLFTVGLTGTKEYRASLEWQDYTIELYNAGKNKPDYNTEVDIYDYYGAYSQEARDTLDSIAEKHGLKLHEKTSTQFNSLEDLYSALGIEGFLPEMGSLGKFEDGGHFPLYARIYDDGSLAVNCSAALLGDSHVIYGFNSYTNGILHRDPYIIVRDTELEEWTYTTDEGAEVMLALGSYQSIMAAELKNCFIYVRIFSGRDNDTSGSDSADISYGEPTLSRELLEAFAESFDFTAINAIAAQNR